MRDRGGTQATAMLRLEAQRNEQRVLAESALAGERRVAIARLVMVALFAVSFEVWGRALGQELTADPVRMAVGAGYAAFGAAMAVWLWTRRVADPRLARYGPVAAALTDFAFITFMGMRGYQVDGQAEPAMGVIAFAVLIAFSVARFSWLHVALSTALACAAHLFLSWYTGGGSALITPFVLGGFATLGILVGMTNRAVRRMFTDLRKRDNLSRFLAPAVAERVLAHGERALAPVQAEVTVLFCDIRGFTRLSENLAPREVLELLDDYLGRMARVIKGHDGVVNKFIGDGILAFWGVPDPDPEHAARAVRAALDLRRELIELNRIREGGGLAPIQIGIGIHTGTVAAGMLGGAEQHEYTVIGDAVNLASRIEGLTKQFELDLLFSESTRAAAGDRFAAERVGEEPVRGRSEPVVVYTIARA